MNPGLRLVFAVLIAVTLSLAVVFAKQAGYQVHIYTDQGNVLKLGAQAASLGDYFLYINQPREFDFNTKEQILAERKTSVADHSILLGRPYRPRSGLFEGIEDNKPWWGMDGMYFFGPGQGGIQGQSEESRFLLNPFLLIGLYETGVQKNSLQPGALSYYYFPLAENLVWTPKQSSVRVDYYVSGYFQYLVEIRSELALGKKLGMHALNARDFGYDYLFIDKEKSKNIDSVITEPAKIKQFIHCGPSCGYETCCNNMSPSQPELEFSVKKLPAELLIKLWKNKPVSGSVEADMLYEIQLT